MPSTSQPNPSLEFYRSFYRVVLPSRLCILFVMVSIELSNMDGLTQTNLFDFALYAVSACANVLCLIGLPVFAKYLWFFLPLHLILDTLQFLLLLFSYWIYSEPVNPDYSNGLLFVFLGVLTFNFSSLVYFDRRKSLFVNPPPPVLNPLLNFLALIWKIIFKTFKFLWTIASFLGGLIYCFAFIISVYFLPPALLFVPPLIICDWFRNLPSEYYTFGIIISGVLEIVLPLLSLILAYNYPVFYVPLPLLALPIVVGWKQNMLSVAVYIILLFDFVYPFAYSRRDAVLNFFNNATQKIKKFFENPPTPEELAHQEELRRELERKQLEQEKEKQRALEEEKKRRLSDAKRSNERILMYEIAHSLPVYARSQHTTFLEPDEDFTRKEQLRLSLESKTLEELAGAPLDVSFDKCDLPIDHDSPGTYGRYTVYCTFYGKRYHLSEKCSLYMKETHMFTALANGLSPCRNCAKGCPLEIPEWYMNYRRLLQDKRTYKL